MCDHLEGRASTVEWLPVWIGQPPTGSHSTPNLPSCALENSDENNSRNPEQDLYVQTSHHSFFLANSTTDSILEQIIASIYDKGHQMQV